MTTYQFKWLPAPAPGAEHPCGEHPCFTPTNAMMHGARTSTSTTTLCGLAMTMANVFVPATMSTCPTCAQQASRIWP